MYTGAYRKLWRWEWEIEFEIAICYNGAHAVKFSKRTEIDISSSKPILNYLESDAQSSTSIQSFW